MRKMTVTLLTGILILFSVNVGGQADCVFVYGDFNCNGIPCELTDFFGMVALYRGYGEVCYTCDCGLYGEEFPVIADPNGNCIPFELADVAYALYVCRGLPPLICPDCLRADDRLEQTVPDSSGNQE